MVDSGRQRTRPCPSRGSVGDELERWGEAFVYEDARGAGREGATALGMMVAPRATPPFYVRGLASAAGM